MVILYVAFSATYTMLLQDKLALPCTLTLLLLLGEDIETNPGPSKQWQRRQADKQRRQADKQRHLSLREET